MITTRMSDAEREGEAFVFTPPRYFDVGTAAWTVASGFFYGAATLCTLYWILYLCLIGFTPHLVFALLFWNILPWLIALYTRKRVHEARQRTALARERQAVLANALTEAVQEALARKAAGAARTLPARRAHWWTDTQTREENIVKVQQR